MLKDWINENGFSTLGIGQEVGICSGILVKQLTKNQILTHFGILLEGILYIPV
jgi:hypothetical protein